MIRAIWEYIRERKWRYVKIAMVLILYDYTFIDPDASHPALSGSFESADADAIQLCMGYGPLGRISHPQLSNGFFIGSCDSFSRQSISRQPFRDKRFVLVAMRRPFF